MATSDDHEHAAHAGRQCAFEGGACRSCGVSESLCDACGGVGYHEMSCPESDDAESASQPATAPLKGR